MGYSTRRIFSCESRPIEIDRVLGGVFRDPCEFMNLAACSCMFRCPRSFGWSNRSTVFFSPSLDTLLPGGRGVSLPALEAIPGNFSTPIIQ
jgi:hypothetical protein